MEKIEPSESRVWKIGTVIFVSGSLLNFTSYGFAAQQLLASLEAIQFVSNVVFQRFILGRRDISNKIYAGSVLTLVGCATAVSFSSKREVTFTVPQMMQARRRLPSPPPPPRAACAASSSSSRARPPPKRCDDAVCAASVT